MTIARSAAVSAICAVLAVGVYAAPADDGVAVIVGNRNYTDERVPEVAYAHRDADAFRRYVIDVLGFDEANVIDLRDATQAEMETAFGNERDHKGKLWSYLHPEGSDVVVYYSGHGVPGLRDRKGYLLPVNANPDTAHLNGYPIDQLYANLGKLAEATSVRVFLDACFSGASQGGMLIDAASPVFVSAQLPALADKAMAVLTAASGDQVASWDKDAEHGAFTHHLLDALYGDADADANGEVTALETKRYLDRHMTRAVRRAYLRDQRAGVHGDGSMVLAFAPRGGFPARPTLTEDGPDPRPQPFTVLTEPGHARVRILNIVERYRPGIELPSGEYRTEASAEGYDTVVEVVRHGSAEPTEHRIVLRRTARQWTRGERFRDCPGCPEMVVIPAGRFRMGCVSGRDCGSGEEPVHDVWIGFPFALSVHEVTFAEWDSCVSGGGCAGYRPDDEGWGRGNRPVINVSWDDVQLYASWLSSESGQIYRLPSESEWEYSVRAGTTTTYHFGNDEWALCRYGNHADASVDYSWRNSSCSDGIGGMTAPVGSYVPNAFGLYDMHGNVLEWVEDCRSDSYVGAPVDGAAWLAGDCVRRIWRGGSWVNQPERLRAARRSWSTTGARSYSVGFRVARTLTR